MNVYYNFCLQAEQLFQNAQAERRQQQQQMTTLHNKLKEIHAALDKVQRGEERYLALLTEEYEVLREEKRVSMTLSEWERAERDGFTTLSSAVRESHERERARAERTKYWSIIGSVIGATIGIVGSSVNNYRRNRELRNLVHDSAAGGADLRNSVSELVSTTRQQQEELRTYLSALSIGVARDAQPPPLANALLVKDIIDAIHVGDAAFEKELSDLKRMIAALSAPAAAAADDNATGSSVVYVGPEIKDLLARTETNINVAIREKMLMSSVVLYTAGVVTAGILYGIIRTYG